VGRAEKVEWFFGPQYLVEPPYMEGNLEGRWILVWLLDPRPDYPELMHPCSHGTRVEAQDLCGPILFLDTPPGFRKAGRCKNAEIPHLGQA